MNRCDLTNKKLKLMTVVFLFRNRYQNKGRQVGGEGCSAEILLGRKKRGWMKGIYNGFGGKREGGETMVECAIREMKEECDADVTPEQLHHVGILRQSFKDKPESVLQFHIYTCDQWKGSPTETDEMDPQWFGVGAIPYGNMWKDDIHWYPLMMNDNRFEGDLHFTDDDNMEWFDIREVRCGLLGLLVQGRHSS